ncbi:CaiB/BaiF CoA transferase family protein [Nocardioides sp. BYT-33-1]|uniref:CaiB/BaiF CoA transferase family protein n=1 Tax=Nocardioides sp. BYT-33-1 TaxID=3416952 RepID=UPI003F52AD2D
MMMPLADVRILAVEQYGAGPFGSLQLADLGADVIKIENPNDGGDVGRYVPPFAEGEDSLFFESLNRGKRSVSLDIKSEAGRAIFERLVADADAVYFNLRGDVPKKLGITYDQLAHINPAIVCCSLSGFGMSGPRRAEPGYDYVLQGLAGWMSLTGEPDGPPTKSGLSLVDLSGGLVAALSLLAAVHAARRDGRGMDCDVSLYDTSMSMLSYLATWHLSAGYDPQRMARSAHPSLVPFQLFPTRDGWIVAGCAKEKFWQRLAIAIGRPGLVNDPRFESFEKRFEHREALQEILDEALRAQTTDHWIRTLREAGVPSGPVHDVPRALDDPHTHARDLVISTSHPRLGDVRHVRSAVRAGSAVQEYQRAPRRGEHGSDVLHDLGMSESDIAEAVAAGAFGDPDRSLTTASTGKADR